MKTKGSSSNLITLYMTIHTQEFIKNLIKLKEQGIVAMKYPQNLKNDTV